MIYLLLTIYILNLMYLKKQGLFASSFIIHFFFISIIFIGPSVYYELGFTTYAHSFEDEDLQLFEVYGIIVFTITLVYLYFLKHIKKAAFNAFFVKHSNKNLNFTSLYFVFWYALVLGYLLFYASELPIIKFIFTGNLPDRLDQSESVQLFYTFSSFFMIFIPSGYFFFIRYLKGNLTKFLLLLLVIFILTSGGHKGLVTFFILFALFFSGFRFNLKYILIGSVSLVALLGIYTLSKGRDFSKETFLYLLESPPRRFFVTQGSGFIARIAMDRKNLYKGDVFGYQVIKRETFQEIYPNTNKLGAAPTMFMGDLHVRYGMALTIIAYILYLIACFPLVKGTDNMPERKLYIWWNIFIFFYLLGVAEFSYTSTLRILLSLFNFTALLLIPYLKLKKS